MQGFIFFQSCTSIYLYLYSRGEPPSRPAEQLQFIFRLPRTWIVCNCIATIYWLGIMWLNITLHCATDLSHSFQCKNKTMSPLQCNVCKVCSLSLRFFFLKAPQLTHLWQFFKNKLQTLIFSWSLIWLGPADTSSCILYGSFKAKATKYLHRNKVGL